MQIPQTGYTATMQMANGKTVSIMRFVGGGIADEDMIVNIKESEGFVNLKPGDSWTKSYSISNYFPYDEAVEEFLLYQFQGATMEWCD